MKHLAKVIGSPDRTGCIKVELSPLLSIFKREHEKMIAALRKNLNDSEKHRLRELRRLLSTIHAKRKEGVKNTNSLLDAFIMEHKGEGSWQKEFRALTSIIQAKQKEREKEINDLLKTFREEIRSVR
jgi:hypothetical protein